MYKKFSWIDLQITKNIFSIPRGKLFDKLLMKISTSSATSGVVVHSLSHISGVNNLAIAYPNLFCIVRLHSNRYKLILVDVNSLQMMFVEKCSHGLEHEQHLKWDMHLSQKTPRD